MSLQKYRLVCQSTGERTVLHAETSTDLMYGLTQVNLPPLNNPVYCRPNAEIRRKLVTAMAGGQPSAVTYGFWRLERGA